MDPPVVSADMENARVDFLAKIKLSQHRADVRDLGTVNSCVPRGSEVYVDELLFVRPLLIEEEVQEGQLPTASLQRTTLSTMSVINEALLPLSSWYSGVASTSANVSGLDAMNARQEASSCRQLYRPSTSVSVAMTVVASRLSDSMFSHMSLRFSTPTM